MKNQITNVPNHIILNDIDRSKSANKKINV